MKFDFPLGFIALIAIPIILILYLLLHKFEEKDIASTYIWKVSERMEKKKVPLSNISQPWIMFLQIIIAFLLVIGLTTPILIKQNAENYYFILDNSGSMSMQDGESTRFDMAKSQINEIVKKANVGSKYSILLTCGKVIKVLDESDSKDDVYTTLNQLSVTNMYSTNQSVMNTLQDDFNKDNNIKAYLVSDKDYEQVKNIEVINVAKNDVENYSIENMNYQIIDGHIQVVGNVYSYLSDEKLSLILKINDQPIKSQEIDVKKLQRTSFEFSILETDFEKISVEIANNDALLSDNLYTVFKQAPKDIIKVAIVSNNPFYLNTVIQSLVSAQIDLYTPNTYLNETGYNLYVFDGFAPTTLPSDGGIWLFNVDQNIANSGFVYQNQVILDKGGALSYANSSSTFYKTLTTSVLQNTIHISRYLKYSIYTSLTPILTYEGIPVVFAGLNEVGTRQVVFAFDLHNSDLPLLLDYIILMKNFLNYSVPEVMNQFVYQCGSNLTINVLPNCESIEVITPSKQNIFLNVNQESTLNYPLSEVGEYQLEVKIADKITNYHFYASFSSLESNPKMNGKSIALLGEKSNAKFPSESNVTIYILSFALLLLVMDWLLYFFSKL